MSGKRKRTSSPLEELLPLQDWTIRRSGNWLTKHLSFAIEHLPDKEELIFKVFKNSVLVLFLLKKNPRYQKRILSTLGCQRKSKWTTFLDNLNSSNDLSSLTTQLLQILLQALISKEKVCRPFWMPAYKELSERLLLPTETDSVALDTNLLNNWSPKQEEKLPSFKKTKTEHVNRNSPTTSLPSSMSSLADKWEKEVTAPAKLKTMRVKIYPTTSQKKVLNEFIDTARYTYNRAVEEIEKGHKVNFYTLRDVLVTEKSKKSLPQYKTFDDSIKDLKLLKKSLSDEDAIEEVKKKIDAIQNNRRVEMKKYKPIQNQIVPDFVFDTPKDIRSNAVQQCCSAYKSGFTNLRHGNIKYFKMKFKKKTENRQTIELTPKIISIEKCKIKIVPDTLGADCYFPVSKKNEEKIRHLKIENNVDIVRQNDNYYVHLLMSTNPSSSCKFERVAGVDLGLRKLATVHTHSALGDVTEVTEYIHRKELIKKLNKRMDLMKQTRGNRCRKKSYRRIEKRKSGIVDRLHWDFINDLLKHNDVIYLGDIKSHDIVTGGKNKAVNREFNDLKFYLLKQRLVYKASLCGKILILVPEHYTTKTCSCCGVLNNEVGSKEIFTCGSCNLIAGRDINASKNIKMKGYFQ